MTPTEIVLGTKGLTKAFESEGAPVRALRGLDFTMAAGEFVAVMGPSGCGKSTLLNLVAGLDTPSDGEVIVAGESLDGKDENDLARVRRKHIQRQRLAIARALANQPTPVLADEPTGALDSEGGMEVLELFRRLHVGGQTILMVTHDQDVADAGDRIVRMKDGRVDAGTAAPARVTAGAVSA